MKRNFALLAVIAGFIYLAWRLMKKQPGFAEPSGNELLDAFASTSSGLTKLFGDIPDELLEAMALSIADFESGGDLNARSYRNNNPGNLRWSGNLDKLPWAGALGVDDTNHVVFTDYKSGWNALLKQLYLAFTGKSAVYNPGMTLFQFFAKYAEANTQSYARTVAAALGVQPGATLNQILEEWA
jgi:hypothetical protein